MIGPLFLSLIIVSFDAGSILIRGMLLDRATDLATRQIRVGASTAAADAAGLKADICGRTILRITSCVDNLTVEMTSVKVATDIPAGDATCVTRILPKPTLKYAAGGRADLIFLRACLAVTPAIPLVGRGLGLPRSANGDFRIVSVTTYVNEP